jgi:deoxyribodipyrimidine photolyase-like uncharacterized protein
MLSFPLNCGLILPTDVCLAIVKAGGTRNNLEAFLRQLIGWREYAKMYYVVSVERSLKPSRMYFRRNTRRLRRDVWFVRDYRNSLLNTTRVPETLRILLKPCWDTGYAHHIIRLYLLSVMV